MNHCLIINAYSARNAGDAAIMLATAQLIRECAGGTRVTIASRYYEEDREFYVKHDIEVVPPLVPFPPGARSSDSSRVIRLVVGIIGAWIAVLAYRVNSSAGRSLARRFGLTGLVAAMTADVVVLAGGGYLYSARRKVNLTLLHLALGTRIATTVNKHCVMMPQSIGPLTNAVDRWMVGWALRNIHPIVVREQLSLAEAQSLFGRSREIAVCPDVAFVTTRQREHPGPRIARADARSQHRIGFVVMDWTWARSGGDLDAYVAKLSVVTQELVALGHQVAFSGHSRIPEHGQDDFEVVRRVVDAVNAAGNRGDGMVIEAALDLDDLTSYFSGLDVVVGTRLHSCILAMTSGTPAIALAYQPKTSGTYALLGLKGLCLDVETFEPTELLARIVCVLENLPSSRTAVEHSVSDARAHIVRWYEPRFGGEVP